jgi:hypothetical protein
MSGRKKVEHAQLSMGVAGVLDRVGKLRMRNFCQVQSLSDINRDSSMRSSGFTWPV